jgi:GNAT superfamily N-acetyltransferase
MIELSKVWLRDATDDDYEFAYDVKKKAEGGYITELFGWNEQFQRDFHDKEWRKKPPQIIEYDNQPIGTIAIERTREYFSVGRFFIMPDFQHKGIGTYLLTKIIDEGDNNACVIKLAHLVNNPCNTLYERLGFRVVRQEGTLVYRERNS